jgi:hypothetical protein
VVVALGLSACGTTVVTVETNPSPRPLRGRSASSVEVFSASQPERLFVEIGIIEARQSTMYSNDDLPEIIQEMRARAGEMGCDAVILTGGADRVVGTTGTNKTAGSVRSLTGYRGTCIVYRDEGKAPPTASAGAAETEAAAPPRGDTEVASPERVADGSERELPTMEKLVSEHPDPRLQVVRDKLMPILPRARACFDGVDDAPESVQVKVVIRASGTVKYLGHARPPVSVSVGECLRTAFQSVGRIPNPGEDITINPIVRIRSTSAGDAPEGGTEPATDTSAAPSE